MKRANQTKEEPIVRSEVDTEEAMRRARERAIARQREASQKPPIQPKRSIAKPHRASSVVPNKRRIDALDVVQECGLTLRQIRELQDRELSPED